MIHCMKFRYEDIWFLTDNNDSEQRKLVLGTCPVCGRFIGEYFAVDKASGKIIFQKLKKRKLEKFMDIEKNNIVYTTQQLNKSKFKKKLSGGSMGLIQQS